MNGRVERIMQEYRQMVMERVCLENQIRNFQGITEEEMIDSLQFSQPDAERVQTSGVSDKPDVSPFPIKARWTESTRNGRRTWKRSMPSSLRNCYFLSRLRF